MGKIDVNVPDIGDFRDVPVIEVLVKPGDEVKVYQSLVTLESDKATMDVPSPAAGKITEVFAKVGDKVSMGSLIAKLEASRAATPTSPEQEDEAEAKEEEDAAEAPKTSPVGPSDLPPRPAAATAGPAIADFSGVFAGPAVRRLARELESIPPGSAGRLAVPEGHGADADEKKKSQQVAEIMNMKYQAGQNQDHRYRR